MPLMLSCCLLLKALMANNLVVYSFSVRICEFVWGSVVCSPLCIFLIECAGNWLSRTWTWTWLASGWGWLGAWVAEWVLPRCTHICVCICVSVLFGYRYRYLLAICWHLSVSALWITALDLVRLLLFPARPFRPMTTRPPAFFVKFSFFAFPFFSFPRLFLVGMCK